MPSSQPFIVPNNYIIKLWSLFVFSLPLLLLLPTISLISSQGLSQHIQRGPDQDYHILQGQRLTIPCIVLNRQGQCQWLRNGYVVGNIVGSYKLDNTPPLSTGDCSITIERVRHIYDEGVWQCQVTPSAVDRPGLQSIQTRLTVLVTPDRPNIKQAVNGNLQVYSDRSSEIECQSNNGNPPPLISWFIGDENITQNSRSNTVIAPDNSTGVVSYLTYTFKQSQHNSSITCQIVHQTISQNTSARVDVFYAPQVSVSQQIFTVNKDSNLKVECQVDANPEARAVWKSLNYKRFNNVRYESNSLLISNISRYMNNALFECSATNDVGTSQPVSFSLDVLYEPQLLNSSEPTKTVNLGQTIHEFCDYDGNPKPKVLWYHINPISDSVRHLPYSENNGSNLILHNVTYNDEGHYYCEAVNHNILTGKDSIVRSNQFVVDIIGKPAIIQSIDTVQGFRGTPSEITQHFCSDPTPLSASWQFGSITLDVKIHSDSSQRPLNVTSFHSRYTVRDLIPIDKTLISTYSSCFQAILLIDNTDLNDQRDYMFVVTNQYGRSESIVKLKVVSQWSAAIMITIGLIVLIMCSTLVVVTLLFIKRRKLGRDKTDDESKEEVRAPMKPDNDKPEKEPEKEKGENHELVYANLDFAKPTETKPSKTSKPQAQQRQFKSNGGNTNTEYAQITFANKADL